MNKYILVVYDVLNLVYYEHWTDKRKYFYTYLMLLEGSVWLSLMPWIFNIYKESSEVFCEKGVLKKS